MAISARMTYRIAVVGESYANADGARRQDIIRKYCKAGAKVSLVHEPENPHDENAVAVFLSSPRLQIGYLPSSDAKWIVKAATIGWGFSSSIDAVVGGVAGKPNLGVVLLVEKSRSA